MMYTCCETKTSVNALLSPCYSTNGSCPPVQEAYPGDKEERFVNSSSFLSALGIVLEQSHSIFEAWNIIVYNDTRLICNV